MNGYEEKIKDRLFLEVCNAADTGINLFHVSGYAFGTLLISTSERQIV